MYSPDYNDIYRLTKVRVVKSFCYGVIAYKTAWLSHHYPAEFATANCTVNEDQEAVTATLTLAKKRKIEVLPPDINYSGIGFTLNNGIIRYGLKAIKVADKKYIPDKNSRI